MSFAVETTKLTKRYGSTPAVDQLSITVREGEVYGFLGPNGAGKTTTLRMLLGLIRPTSGSLTLFGERPRGLARVGALIEGPTFYPYLSGRTNLRVLADHAGVSRRRVDEVLELVDLTDRAAEVFRTYSLGMKQRLGLAAVLLKDPDLLILDEPTNGLDPAGMADMRQTIRRLAEDGRTVLLSSHLLAEVEQICDRVGVLHKGKLLIETTVAELTSGGGSLRVTATPADTAYTVLTAVVGADHVHADNEVFELDVPATEAARINAELVAAGVSVSELRWLQPALEDMFLQLTGVES
ncbi:ABC transporter ATP-binding protein [Thermocrispum municipale]|uniref:ABC transporter ATP-binding protein n=1 Tax=Thermocrispum municipale TaxID=37926 RepID=UPI0004185F96|nr:ABC transporter ATP-binding protein [Thermocrispum municipale]